MKKNKTFLITFTFFFSMFFLTIGYARYNKELTSNINLTLKNVGKVRIIKDVIDNNATNTLPKNAGKLSLDNNGNLVIDYTLQAQKRNKLYYEITHLVTIENSSPFDYKFIGIKLNHKIQNGNGVYGTITHAIDANNKKNQLNSGDTLKANTTKVVAVKLEIVVGATNNGTVIINGTIEPNVTLNQDGNFQASLLSKEIDLSGGKDKACFDIDLINTYQYRQIFNLSSSNTNFVLVDKNDKPLQSYFIDGPDNNNPSANKKKINLCLKPSPDSIFLDNTSSTSIVLTTNDLKKTIINDLKIKVDIKSGIDNKPPEIDDVQFSPVKYDPKNQSLITDVRFKRIDNGGTDVLNYFISLYNTKSSTPLITYNTKNSVENVKFILDKNFLTNNNDSIVVNNDNFYVKVYGIDKAGNSGESYCNSNDNNNYCVSSLFTNLKYKFNVDLSKLVNIDLSNQTTNVFLNNSFITTLNSYGNNYAMPGDITITMNGQVLDSKYYKYYQNENSITSGELTIYDNVINGDISIEGNALYNGGVCLLEGTKIKLANGLYKNIEDIKYNDLILAFSYDLGRIVYEFPIWIEKAGTTDSYQKITFSDGTILNTVGSHGIFSKDLNKYVSVLDKNNFHIGTNVVKFNSNNMVSIVQVSKIESIKKKAKYYHVSSTRYHNVIANDLLTTDAMLVVSNMFPFKNDMTWSEERNEFLEKNDLFYYQDWLEYFPKHIFQGFRMEEAKHLYNNNLLDIQLFSDLLGRLIVEPIKNNNNINMWPVLTSEELISNDINKLYLEDSYYVLPEPNNLFDFAGWYNTSDNKIYMPGDKVEVQYGMFFEKLTRTKKIIN